MLLGSKLVVEVIRKSPWRIYLLAGLILCVYGRTLGFGFVLYDDDLHIFGNKILSASLWEAIRYFWTHIYKGFFIPLTYTVWALVVECIRPLDPSRSLQNLDPTLFHALNISFHLANTLLVYGLLLRFLKNKNLSFWGSFIFAFHPLQVETVAWATGFKELLSSFFALSSLSFYFGTSRMLALFLFLLALLSKPGVIILPLIIVGLEIWIFNRKWKDSFYRIIPFLIVALPVGILTSQLQPPESYSFSTPWHQRPFIAGDALFHYLNKLVFPLFLVHDYGRLPEKILSSGKIWPEFMILLLLIFILRWRRQNLVLKIGALFSLSLLPVLGFVRFAFQDFSTVSDHYVYFGMWVVGLGSAILLGQRLGQNQKIPKAIPVIGVMMAVTSFIQVGVWKDTPTLLMHTLNLNPNSFMSHNNLAVYYEELGESNQALLHYQRCVEIEPTVPQHHYNVGNLLLRSNRLTAARRHFNNTLLVEPKYGEAHFSLGLIFESEGRLMDAEKHFDESLKANPMAPKNYIKLADIYWKQGKRKTAMEFYRHAILIDPLSLQAHLALAKKLAVMGLAAESQREFQAASSLRAEK